MKKRAFKDVIINLIAASVCTAALNLVVYPIYAKRFTAEDYGHILTLIGVINLLWAVLGNSLNNTRLILHKNLDRNQTEGTYNPLIWIASLVGGIIGVVILFFFPIHSFLSVVLLFLTIVVGVARVYYTVAFRLKLDFLAQLVANIIVAAGYIVGVLVIKTISWWPLPLLLGEGIAFFYTIKKSQLIREPFLFSGNRAVIVRTYADLILAGLIGNIIAYFDRFLINPMLGAASVAVFSVASFWGKAVTPFIAPTANVMLSYLSQKDSKMSLKKFILLFLASIVPLLLFGVIGIWLAPWITGLLYPTLIQDATPFIIIASLGSLAQSSTNLIMPILLSVCSSKKILAIQIIYFFLYLVIAFLGASYGGLMGFCIATCIIGVIKTIIFFVFGYFTLRKNMINN